MMIESELNLSQYSLEIDFELLLVVMIDRCRSIPLNLWMSKSWSRQLISTFQTFLYEILLMCCLSVELFDFVLLVEHKMLVLDVSFANVYEYICIV